MTGGMQAVSGIERIDPDLQTGEAELLRQFLDYHRATIKMKCAGLSDEQLKQRSVATSGLALLGLVRHLTEVERNWFHRMLDGQPHAPLYFTPEDEDGDFDNLDSAPVADVWAAYDQAVRQARQLEATFSDPAELARASTGRPRNLRWVMVHMIEEYARHNGHADLLREAIDGEVGE